MEMHTSWILENMLDYLLSNSFDGIYFGKYINKKFDNNN